MNTLGKSLCRFWHSSIGKKWIVALTGAVMVLFLIGHLSGNLLMYFGREAMNDYANFLHDLAHGTFIWIARGFLLFSFVLHIVATISLVRANRAARGPRHYECEDTVQASKSSRIMIWSGLTVLAFVVFHILHFTIRVDPELAQMKDPAMPGRQDVFGMVVAGFQNPFVVVFYIVGLTLLCSHLRHGIASVFQTLGARTEKVRGVEGKFGWALALILWFGFLTIPVAAITGVFGDPPDVEIIGSEDPTEEAEETE
ncbi:MAG: succinate dehydrogenase cytochrome b subunit [Verrucomicrobiales bacterium]